MIITYLDDKFIDEECNVVGLDPALPYDCAILEGRFKPPAIPLTFDDIEPGDIIWCKVFQENAEYSNLDHETRPFLVLSKNYDMVYGIQITHKPAYTLIDYAVPIENFTRCGLYTYSYLMPNMVRGVPYRWIERKIGRITQEVKDDLIEKLREFKNYDPNDPKYSNCKILDRLDRTLENVYKIVV